MATWTTIPDSSLEPGKPIRSIDALALRDNPVAIAEGALGAPRVVNQWFPFDYETSGDGVIYNSATDGSLASITTPDFEAGFDYLLLASNIGDGTAVATTIQFEPYISPVNAFQSFAWMPLDVDSSNRNRSEGSAFIAMPMLASTSKPFQLLASQKVTATTSSVQSVDVTRIQAVAAQQILRVRIRSSASTNINAGTLTLLKRKTNYPEFV